LADAQDLGSCPSRGEGSNPSGRIRQLKTVRVELRLLCSLAVLRNESLRSHKAVENREGGAAAAAQSRCATQRIPPVVSSI
jgi:hypothetical protein